MTAGTAARLGPLELGQQPRVRLAAAGAIQSPPQAVLVAQGEAREALPQRVRRSLQVRSRHGP